MQFSTIIAAFSLALVATAIPADNIAERTNKPKTTPGQKAQNQCSQTQKASCCNQIVKQTINLIPVNVGIDCTTIDGTARPLCISGLLLIPSYSTQRSSHHLPVLSATVACLLQQRCPGEFLSISSII